MNEEEKIKELSEQVAQSQDPQEKADLLQKLLEALDGLQQLGPKGEDYARELLNMAEQLDSENLRGWGFYYWAGVNMDQGKYEEAIGRFNTARGRLENCADKWGVLHALNKESFTYSMLGRHREGFRKAKKAISLAEEFNNNKFLSNTYNQLGLAFLFLDKTSRAVEALFKSIHYKAKTPEKQNGAQFNNIGMAYMELDEHQKALEYFKKGNEIYQENGKTRGIANTYNNMGIAHKNVGNLEEALNCLFKSLAMKRELNHQHGLANTFGRIAEVYMRYGQYDEALNYLYEGIQIYKKVGDPPGLILNYIQQGECYIGLEDFEKAEKSLEPALNQAREGHFKKLIIKSLEAMASLHQQQEDYMGALKCREEIARVEAIFKEEERKAKVEDLEFEYYMEEKSREITNVLAEISELQQQYRQVNQEKRRVDQRLHAVLPEHLYQEVRRLDKSGNAHTEQGVFLVIGSPREKGAIESPLLNQPSLRNKVWNILENYGLSPVENSANNAMVAFIPEERIQSINFIQAAFHLQDVFSREAERPELKPAIGVHRGRIISGIAGVRIEDQEIWSQSSVTTYEVMAEAQPGEVFVSDSVADFIPTSIGLQSVGRIRTSDNQSLRIFRVQRRSLMNQN